MVFTQSASPAIGNKIGTGRARRSIVIVYKYLFCALGMQLGRGSIISPGASRLSNAEREAAWKIRYKHPYRVCFLLF